MRIIAAQLGHSDPSLTARTYAHITPEASMEAVQALNRRQA
jgi:integrase